MKRIFAAALAAALATAGIGALVAPAYADHDFADVAIVKQVARAADDACADEANDQLEVQGAALVEYCYIITNNGDDVEIESFVDDKLGPINIADDELSAGEVQKIPSGEVLVEETTTNVATLTVFDVDDAGAVHREQMTASATVTVVAAQDPDVPQVEPKFACTADAAVRLFVTVTNGDPDDDALVDIEIGDTKIAEAVLVPAASSVTRDFPESVAQLGDEVRIVGNGSELVFDTASLAGLPRPACAVQGDPDFTG
jgi:hypothetical protein